MDWVDWYYAKYVGTYISQRSIEIRTLEGTSDIGRILKFVSLLSKIYKLAENNSEFSLTYLFVKDPVGVLSDIFSDYSLDIRPPLVKTDFKYFLKTLEVNGLLGGQVRTERIKKPTEDWAVLLLEYKERVNNVIIKEEMEKLCVV